ncbi:MAG TPA: hypothetical protein VN519_07950 [Bryobacteraceae bacterium]|nr:hypothetical protein [Bryobacteraceae bacterium]
MAPPTTHQNSFQPSGAVTGIGSLPFASVSEAIHAVAECSPRIPFWPQLPQLSQQESVIGQGLGLLDGLIEPRGGAYGYRVRPGRIDAVVEALHHSTGELTAVNAAGFMAFEEALASGLFPAADAVKGQIEGPITLSTYLFYRDQPFFVDAALFSAVAFHVSQMVCWQIDRMRRAGLPVLLFLDEPALCLDATVANSVSEEKRLNALAATLDDARRRGAVAGLHCCAERPFRRMCLAQPDIVSFDAHEGLDLFFADPHARQFVRNGGVVAYGLVPTWQGLEGVTAADIFTRWLTAAALAGEPEDLARRAMVTATCGLGLLQPPAVAESFRVAREVGELMRQLAGS